MSKLFGLAHLSYSATSSALSDPDSYPFFARTPPEDTLQAQLMAVLVKDVFGYENVNCLHGMDPYSRKYCPRQPCAPAVAALPRSPRRAERPSRLAAAGQLAPCRQPPPSTIVLGCRGGEGFVKAAEAVSAADEGAGHTGRIAHPPLVPSTRYG